MHEFKAGTLHSGSKTGPVVKSRKQAIAIAMHEGGMHKKVMSHMPKGASQSPKGDIGQLRGEESVRAGGFRDGRVPVNKLKK